MSQREEVDRLVDAVGVSRASAERKVAAVLFTYRCSIACRHCCFGCAAERPEVVMSARQCVAALALLHETGRVIHIAGGEAMLYWDVLADAVQLGAREGVAPHFLETNCSFATNDALVRERFEFLARHGVRGLLASCDPYHQEFVPAERFLRVRRLAREIFGERNFWGSGEPDDAIRAFEGVAVDEARLRAHVRGWVPVMVGTAQQRLAPYLDSRPADDPELPLSGWRNLEHNGRCAVEFEAQTMWELHVDPYGNLQTNCGMILGRLSETTPAQLFAAGPEKANRFVAAVCEGGPLALARLAEREYGFTLPARVAQGCELCYLARAFLRRFHPDVFGPAEIYGGA